MAKVLLIIFTILCFSTTLIANSTKTIKPKPIRVYLYAVLEGGANATLYEVARASISAEPSGFGIVYVDDDLLLAGPDRNSQILGRNQGTTVITGLYEPSVVISYNFMFKIGKYKGSSLKVNGQRLIFVPNQEIPITGGTGVFRGAQGYAISNFISFNPNTTNAFLFEFALYVDKGKFFG